MDFHQTPRDEDSRGLLAAQFSELAIRLETHEYMKVPISRYKAFLRPSNQDDMVTSSSVDLW